MPKNNIETSSYKNIKAGREISSDPGSVSSTNLSSKDGNKSNKRLNMRQSRRRRLLTVSIGVMLVMIAAACAWILSRGKALGEAHQSEVASAVESAEETAIETIQGVDDTAAAYEAAEHVYSYCGLDGSDESVYDACDKAIAAGAHYIVLDLGLSSGGELQVSNDQPGTAMSDILDRYGKSVRYVMNLKDFEDSRMIDAVKGLLDGSGYQDNVILACGDLHFLRDLDAELPDIPKLYVCRSEWGFDTSIGMSYVDIVCVQEWLMTEDRCRIAREHDKAFSAWTLDSEDAIKEAIDIGVDTYFTSDTALAVSLEKEYRD